MDRLAFWKVLRVVTIVVICVAVVFGARTLLYGGPKTVIAKAQSGEIDVLNAVANDHSRNSAEPVAVRGYVFTGLYGLKLCHGKKTTSPPQCVGPSIDLQGVTANSFHLKTSGNGGKRVSWLDDPVAVLGRAEGGQITVSQILK